MKTVRLEVIHDGWNKRKILEDPLTKKKYYPEIDKDTIFFSNIDPHYALTLINASPNVFKLVEGELPDMTVPKPVKSKPKEKPKKDESKPIEEMTYRELQAEFAKVTGGAPAGKTKEELLEGLRSGSPAED